MYGNSMCVVETWLLRWLLCYYACLLPCLPCHDDALVPWDLKAKWTLSISCLSWCFITVTETLLTQLPYTHHGLCYWHLTNEMSLVSSSDCGVQKCFFCFLHCKLINELKGTHTLENPRSTPRHIPRRNVGIGHKILLQRTGKKNLAMSNKTMGE